MMAARTGKDKLAITVRTLLNLLDNACKISFTFEASFLVMTFCTWSLTWVQGLCCADSFQHQVVRKLDDEHARNRCAWHMSGHDEDFRVVVTKIGESISATVAVRCQALSPHPEKCTECVIWSLLLDPFHFPIFSSMLLSKSSHLWWKREGKKKEVTLLEIFCLFVVQ